MSIPKFSVICVVKGESKTLPTLAHSLKEFLERGGDWVVVDTGSADNTAEVARQLGARVFEEGPRFNYVCDEATAKAINDKFVVYGEPQIIKAGDSFFAFDQARNYAMTLAKNDFICTPDADEAWTTLDIDKLNGLIDEGYEKLMVDFVFAHFPDGKPAVEFCADTRLYDRRKIKWKGIIHETMQHQGDVKMGRVGRDVAFLEHFQNKETDRTKYLAGLAWACHQEPWNDRNSHYFARELMYRGYYRSAIKEFRRHIDMNAWAEERGQSMVFLGNCYQSIGEDELALRAWHDAFELTCNRREPLLALAHYWKGKDKKAAVAAYAAAALQIPNNGFYANRVANYTFEPHALMYWAKGWMGDIPAARQHLLKCLEYHPKDEKFLEDMKYYFSEDEIKEAKRKAGIIKEAVVEAVRPAAIENPKVSVLMPAYNAGKYIAKAIQSFLDQTEKDSELIITDDGSTDDTLEIAKLFDDPRIAIYKHTENVSYPAATNTCLKYARGKYIARLDADDWDEPNRLEKCVARLEGTPHCDCVSTSTFRGEEGGMIQISTERQGMVPHKYMDINCYGKGGAPVNATIVAKREVYDAIGGFSTESQYGMDSEWDVRANLWGARWAYIDEPLYYYRKHDKQTVNGRSYQWYRDQQKGFLSEAGKEWNRPFNPKRHLEVMVTGRCNKSCEFCSQATFNRDYCRWDAPVELIEKICRRTLENGMRYEYIQFSGGEPLLWKNIDEACDIIGKSDAFHRIRVNTNCVEKDKLFSLLDHYQIQQVYADTFNADPEAVAKLRKFYPDKAILDHIPHKPLPKSPIDGTLPAACHCDRPCVIGNSVYPCGNFYEHITRLGKNIEDYKDYFCSLDDDWVEFFRGVDKFNMDICRYCLANGKVWERVEYPKV